jgi:hypothetical protein
MSFNNDKASKLLAECHRCCCICHKYCGNKIELHHIIQKNEGGNDSIENAIPVCFECHAEIGSYNSNHPRGRKFTSCELKLHKKQWLELCKNKPEIFTSLQKAEVGPLQALIDELEFNEKVSEQTKGASYCKFYTNQFIRAIREGVISITTKELKDSILDTYRLIEMANVQIGRYIISLGGNAQYPEYKVGDAIAATEKSIKETKGKLLKYLSSEK